MDPKKSSRTLGRPFIPCRHRCGNQTVSINQYSGITSNEILFYGLPGQGFSLQPVVSALDPLQPCPPNLGSGELHSLLRFFIPDPQETVQEVHGDHSPQLPFTVKQWKISFVLLLIAKYIKIWCNESKYHKILTFYGICTQPVAVLRGSGRHDLRLCGSASLQRGRT